MWCNARSFHDFEINFFQFCLWTCSTLSEGDHPIVPFIYSSCLFIILFIILLIYSVIKSSLSLVLKPITKKSKTATDLKYIDLSNEENLPPFKDVETGFGAKKVLKEFIKKIMSVLKKLESFMRKVDQLRVA